MGPRIVVLDGLTLDPGDNPFDALERAARLTVHDRTPPELVLERAAGAAVVLTNKTPLPAAVLDALPGLKLVVVLATGYDVVDVAAARRRGVPVCNVPEYGTESVAQHALALLLTLARQPERHDRAVRAGEWARRGDFSFWLSPQVELAGLTMGIVGLGRIGRRVGELAHAFGMRVVAASRSRRDPPSWPGFAWMEVPELFAAADVVSLHCPQTPETRGMVDADLIARMKPTAFLVNTARGGLVDEASLARALTDGRIAGAAVDVVSAEPIRTDDPLLAAPRCLITPHLAWAALAARRRLMRGAVAAVEGWLAGRPVNVVNGAAA